MNRLFAAACAAMLLTGSLTACSTNTPASNNTGNTNGSASPTGTSYNTAPGGVNEDRNVGGRRTSARGNTTPMDNGRYSAYSDGSLAADRGRTKSSGETPGQELARDARDMINGVGNAVRDMTGMKRSNNANGNSGNMGTNGPTANGGSSRTGTTGPAANGIAGAKGATIGGTDGIGNSTT